MNIVQAPGLISGVKTMANAIRITFDLQELEPDKMAKIFELRQQFGQIVFAEADEIIEIEDIKIPDYIPIEKKDKSPSQRLRNVLFKVWETNNPKGNFDDYYRNQMEIIIQHFKEKIK